MPGGCSILEVRPPADCRAEACLKRTMETDGDGDAVMGDASLGAPAVQRSDPRRRLKRRPTVTPEGAPDTCHPQNEVLLRLRSQLNLCHSREQARATLRMRSMPKVDLMAGAKDRSNVGQSMHVPLEVMPDGCVLVSMPALFALAQQLGEMPTPFLCQRWLEDGGLIGAPQWDEGCRLK